MYIHKVMKKKIDIARSSAERDLTISTTKLSLFVVVVVCVCVCVCVCDQAHCTLRG